MMSLRSADGKMGSIDTNTRESFLSTTIAMCSVLSWIIFATVTFIEQGRYHINRNITEWVTVKLLINGFRDVCVGETWDNSTAFTVQVEKSHIKG